MENSIDIRCIGIETLTDDKPGFSMFITACIRKTDIRRDGKIARCFFPDILESILGIPHILSSSDDGVALFDGIEDCRTFFKDITDIAASFEYPD